MARAQLSRGPTLAARQAGEFVEPFVDFASEGDAVMLLRSLAAGAGFNQETRNSISGFFSERLNEAQSFDPRTEIEAFNGRIGGFGGLNPPPPQEGINTQAFTRAFLMTAAAGAGVAAARKGAQQLTERSRVVEGGLDTILRLVENQGDLNRAAQEAQRFAIGSRRESFQILNITKEALSNEIRILHDGILALTDDLDSEFKPKKAEEKIINRVVGRKQREIKGLQDLAEGIDVNASQSRVRKIVGEKLTAEQRVRARIVNIMDDILDLQIKMDDIKRRGIVTKYVDDILRRAKFVGKFAVKAGGPAAVFLGGRAFRDEMKMLLEQKRRQLSGLEPAGVAGDTVGP